MKLRKIISYSIYVLIIILLVLAYFIRDKSGGINRDFFGRELYKAPFIFRIAKIDEYAGLLWTIADTLIVVFLISIASFISGKNKEL